MPVVQRVFLVDPGDAILGNVGSVNIIDLAPPALPFAAGTGTMLVVGEFEDGPLKTPTEVFGPTDRKQQFGGLGFPIPGQPHAGPVAQQSGGNEAWNGNAFIALANKSYARLIIQRVDNSAGEVEFSRQADLTGGAGPFSGADGDQAIFELNGGPTQAIVTLDAASASILATGAVYPVAITGLTLIVGYDETDAQTVKFLDVDTLLADVTARINGKFAATIASDNGGQLELDSVRQGAGARLQIFGGTALALIGLPTAVVQDLWTVTVTADTAITTELRVSLFVNGVATDFDTPATLGPVGSITDKRNLLLGQLAALGVPGFTFAAGVGDTITALGDPNAILIAFTALQGLAELTIVNTAPGVALAVTGTGNVQDSQLISTAEAANMIDAVGNLSGVVDVDGLLRVSNELTPATGTIRGSGGALLTAFGFNTTTLADAANGPDLVIPAGTRVQDATATGTIWVTMVSTATGTGGGPFKLKVRPFFDIDEALASGAGDVSVVLDTLAGGFTATNPSTITRLTAALLDARYIDAINETLSNAAPTNAVNVVVSARTSAAIRNQLRLNARAATAGGLAGRKAITRPRLGVTRAQARADVAANRDERIQFCFPGWTTVIPEIRESGITGGIGFSDSGAVDVGSDTFLAAMRTAILPETSAAVDPKGTNFGTFDVVGLESAYDPATQGATRLTSDDYISFKANGITAAAGDRSTGAGFMDDVTSVDPATSPGLTSASRRWLADFIDDTLMKIGAPYKAQLIKPSAKIAHATAIRSFLRGMLSPDQIDASRIKGFDIIDDTAAGSPVDRSIVTVTSYAHANAIVYAVTVGANAITTQEVINEG